MVTFFQLGPDSTHTDSMTDVIKESEVWPGPFFLSTGQEFRPSPIRQISVLSFPLRSARLCRTKHLKTVAPPVIVNSRLDSGPRPVFSVPSTEARRRVKH